MIVLRALGTAEIETDVTTLTPSQGIVFAAALYLILERGRRVSRAALASLLWPQVPEKLRAHRLRQTILQLKKLGMFLTADRNVLQSSKDSTRCDTDDLTSWVGGSLPRSQSFDFLPGYSPTFSEPFRDWVDSKRTEVHNAATRVLVHELEQLRLQGDWSKVEHIAGKCLSLDPFNESAVLAQAEAAAMRGGKREAVSILDRYLAEIGTDRSELKLPATILRKRVERVPDRPAVMYSEPPFMGREREMAELTRRFIEALKGRGSAILLTGDPGIGKTRLSVELGRFAELQGGQVQRISCRRSDVHRPLSLFVDIVPQLRELPGSLGCAPETFAELKRLTEFDHLTDGHSRTADSDSLFLKVQAALFDLFDSVSDERCLVILVDDVQWLDESSSKLLAQMAEWSATKRILFILNSRTGEHSFLETLDKIRLDSIHLGPLTRNASNALLRAIDATPGREIEADFVEWCLRVAEGNPFFMLELVHQWIETGHKHEAPPSVSKVLQERISRLTGEALQVLQACAVLGDHATLDRVERVLGLSPHRLLSAVEELSRAAMLIPGSDGIGAAVREFQPRHDFLSSAAIGRLAPVSLGFIHRRCADVLQSEIAQGTMAIGLLWACADHRHNAGDRELALALSLSCAEHLLAVGLPGDSCVAFEKSLEHCTTDEQRLKVLPRLAFAFQLASEWSRSREVLQTCIRLSAKVFPAAGHHNDFELLLLDARFQSSLEYSAILQDLIPCVESSEASPSHRVRAAVMALKIATDIGPAALVDSLYNDVVPFLQNPEIAEANRLEVEIVYRTLRGDVPIPLADLSRFVGSADRTDGVDYLNSLLTAASACRISGMYSEGLQFVSDAVKHAKSQKLTSRLAQSHLAAVRLHIAAREFEQAELALAEAHKHPISTEDPRAFPEISFLESRIAVEKGDVARARAAFIRIEDVPATYSASRRAYYFALGIHIELFQASRRQAIQSFVTKLEEAHTPIQGIGVKDFESYALFLGLCAVGRSDFAIEMLREYVQTHRRSRWPLEARMQAALGSADSGTCSPDEEPALSAV